MKKLLLIILFLFVLGGILLFPPAAQAFLTPHPIKVYDKGTQILAAYHGDDEQLVYAEELFASLIEKHPDSPLGYLGFSHVKLIEAYQYGQRYNMKIISEEALPMALKAMRLGPTLNIVHDHYDRFEGIMKGNDDHQEEVRQMLLSFPENPETYLKLGNYLNDQADYPKALEYYKIALKFAGDDDLRLKAIQRIAWTYLTHLSDPAQAVEYWQQALKIHQDSPAFNEYLGMAYFQLNEYALSVENLSKAAQLFNSPNLQAQLMQAQGFLYKQEGKTDLAIEAIEKALSLNSQNTALHYQLGILYYGKKDFKNAYQHFRDVIEAGLSDAQTLYWAGRSASLLGQEDIAKEYYQQYLELQGDGVEADWIRQNIPDLSQR